jgi:hypothetical protein
MTRWQYGEVVVRREVLGLAPIQQVDGAPPAWLGKPWIALPVHVVEDTEELLVTYLPCGAEFGFYPGDWPTPNRQHPWADNTAWRGHGCLMLQRPGDHHAVWHFWSGRDRAFSHWYLNIQTEFARTAIGYDTQDLELDVIVYPDGRWVLKDDDVLVDRVEEGRFSFAFVAWIEQLGKELVERLGAGERWWDPAWSTWTPEPSWQNTPLPRSWLELEIVK